MKRLTHTLHGGSPKTLLTETVTNKDGGKTTRKYLYSTREPGYFKTYAAGREIYAQLDFAPHGLVFDLMFLAQYGGENSGIFALSPSLRQELAKNNHISPGRLKNIFTKMLEINFLVRVGHGAYQINPSVCARGAWKDTVLADELYRERRLPKAEEATQ